MKKECRRFQHLLNRCHDREASPLEREALEEHLEGCPQCREEAAAMEKLSLFFQAGERLHASGGFTERVTRKIEEVLSLSPWNAVLPFIQRMAVAAVIVMMISFSFLFFQGGENKREPAAAEWKGLLSSHTFSHEEKAVLFGEGLTPENARKIWGDSER